MKSSRSFTPCFVVACVLVLSVGVARPSRAQTTTTGTLSGAVADQQGGVLPGVTVTAVHTPTGTTYEGVTQADGRFTFGGVRVGGPYTISVSLSGFRDQSKRDVNVGLGAEQVVNFKLELATVAETITVTAEALPVFSPSATGAGGNVEQEVLATLPTISRSLQDFARTNPFFVQTSTNQNPTALSVAGRSGRYNNLQIDGAVNNDLFGLADTATPGGQANTEPVSLDAIQELQLVVSPYDVRQGSFSGGGINAITRGGTNRFRGTGYYYFRDQGLVGDGPNDRPIATFSDKLGGGSLGGRIVRNRLFFFGNGEFQRRQTPSGFSITGNTGQAFGRQAEAERVLAIARNRYGHTPAGGLDEFIRSNPNDKVFARVDANLGRSQLNIRHNFVKGQQDVGTQTNNIYLFADRFYQFNSKTNSTVGQVNTTIKGMFNEARVTFQRIRDFRSNAAAFPHVRIRLPDGGRFEFGTEQFSARNELDQDIIELHDDLTMVRGKHTYTFGTHNEFFKFRNLFIRANFGFYDFNGIDLFEQGFAQDYSHSFSATSDPLQAANFWVYQLGFYAGDQWRVRNNLTLTYGLRVDMPIFPDKPAYNPRVEQLYGKRTDVAPSTRTWSPRIGFNYDLSNGGRRSQARGGVGLFSGRTPYVWISNQYTNTGLEFIRISTGFNANNRVPFSPDPLNQPKNVGQAATNEINLIDPDYDYPQLIRGNLGYDRELGFGGLVASAELLFSSTIRDIAYENLNLTQAGTRPDGRPFYRRTNTAFSDVVNLKNTDQGESWSLALKLDKPFRNGWFARGSYLYGRSKSVNDGGSSQARSNWVNTYNKGNPNDIPLATSNFDPGHRLNMSLSYQIRAIRRAPVTLSMYYEARQGRPYGYQYSNDVNVDGGFTNDLFYIPGSASEVIVNNASFDDLMRFLTDNGNCDVRTGIIEDRNICRSPWTNTMDFRAAVDVPFGRRSAEITVDVVNFLNLLSKDKGVIDFALFNDLLPAGFAVNAATGQYIYNVNAVARPNTTTRRYTRDDLRSRWQALVGLRLKF